MIHVYHGATSSGRFAAYVVWRFFAEKKHKESINFVESNKDENTLIDLTRLDKDDTIYFLDLNYPAQSYNNLTEVVSKVIVIAGEAIESGKLLKTVCYLQRNSYSAALLTWHYFYGYRNLPTVGGIIDDYFTERRYSDSCLPLEAWLQKENFSHEWARWNQLCRHPDALTNAIAEGKLILEQSETTQ